MSGVYGRRAAFGLAKIGALAGMSVGFTSLMRSHPGGWMSAGEAGVYLSAGISMSVCRRERERERERERVRVRERGWSTKPCILQDYGGTSIDVNNKEWVFGISQSPNHN